MKFGRSGPNKLTAVNSESWGPVGADVYASELHAINETNALTANASE